MIDTIDRRDRLTCDSREDLVHSGQTTLRNGLAAASTNAADWPKTEMRGVHSNVKPLT